LARAKVPLAVAAVAEATKDAAASATLLEAS
jgi:hypothetical protein